MRHQSRQTPAYAFNTQLDLGKQAEAFLDRYFARWYDIQHIPIEVEKRDGYDRIFVRKTDQQPVKVEYKADFLAAESGNAFIETISVYEDRKAGWAYTSQADMLVYFVPPLGLIHMIPLNTIRLLLPGWKLRYREVSAPNQGYRTYGILLPLERMKRLGLTHSVPPFAWRQHQRGTPPP